MSMVSGKDRSGKGESDVSGEQLVANLLKEIGQVLHSEEFGESAEELLAEHTFAAKEAILVRIRSMLMRTVTQSCLATDRGYQGPYAECPECGGRARFVRHDAKGYVVLTGEVELQRSLYECGCGHRWHPLDEAWKLPSGRFSEGVVRVVTLLGGAMPFARAAEVLWETAGITVSASQVRAETEAIGQEMEMEIAEGVAQAQLGEVISEAPPEVLVMGADGAMINTREDAWKEVKVGRVMAYRRRGPKSLVLEKSSYVAHLGSVEDFRPKLDAEVQRRGGWGEEATIFVGDGAPWIWEMASEITPDAIQVLDYYHLKEHVHTAAQVLFGEGTAEAETWTKKIAEEQLRQGKIDTAIAMIEETGGESETKEKARRDLIRYIQTNRNRMGYPELEAHGYPIGSGAVESACKQIVVQRHKQSGMRWSKSGAQKMLNVVAYYHGDRWAEFWEKQEAA